MRRLMIPLLALFTVFSFTTAVQGQNNVSWTGQYFGNPDFQTPVVATRVDSDISFNWGYDAPLFGMPSDNFSVRWFSSAYFSAGTYRFTARADDYIRVVVDNNTVLDTFTPRRVDEVVLTEVTLTEGFHNIRVDYREVSGPAFLRLDWTLLQAAQTPADALRWVAEYYNNTTLAGSPAAIVNETSPSHNWGSGSPVSAVSDDNFSARWRTTVVDAGTYLLDIAADDGVRVYVDGQIIVNQWHGARPDRYTATFNVAPGTARSLTVEYFETVGLAFLDFDIVNLDDTQRPVWNVEYFNNRDLRGTPVAREVLLDVSANWGNDAPVNTLPRDEFSVRWTSEQELPSGSYKFTLSGDDGMRVYVDNRLIIDEWHLATADEYEAVIALREGEHTIVVEFFEASGIAFIEYEQALTTEPPSVDDSLIPRANATITAPRLNVRTQPTTDAQIIQRVEGGGVYDVVGKNADSTWWQILVNGQPGWVFANYVSVDRPGAVPITSANDAPDVPLTGITGIIGVDVNVRSDPGASEALLGTIRAGARVNLVGRNASMSWIQIEFRGTVGWILRSTLESIPNGVLRDLPVR